MLRIYTATTDYPGPSRLDLTRYPFAAPQNVSYLQHLRSLYRQRKELFEVLLTAKYVVLCCDSPWLKNSNRDVLADALVKLGGKRWGEITEWDHTIEFPCYSEESGIRKVVGR